MILFYMSEDYLRVEITSHLSRSVSFLPGRASKLQLQRRQLPLGDVAWVIASSLYVHAPFLAVTPRLRKSCADSGVQVKVRDCGL